MLILPTVGRQQIVRVTMVDDTVIRYGELRRCRLATVTQIFELCESCVSTVDIISWRQSFVGTMDIGFDQS